MFRNFIIISVKNITNLREHLGCFLVILRFLAKENDFRGFEDPRRREVHIFILLARYGGAY